MTTALGSRTRLRLPPLQVLAEAPQPPGFDLPNELAAVYSGPLGFSAPRGTAGTLLSLRGNGSCLFLRYEFPSPGGHDGH